MKHLQLKFNHGVEIGAYWAYRGHAKRTKELMLVLIYMDEWFHRKDLAKMLDELGHKPSKIINGFFYLVGWTIFCLCQVCPIWSLNFVAQVMEKFAVYSYESLAEKYPQYRDELLKMATKEKEHEDWFSV